ncbi:precorrin-4 C(11)-methyltransferase [uncultured Methanobrevibacter sp.]|uniref:precorrin-4 C(11)-methyltransferase n=1 Tax=uncultured Methanobrevibacter sp. TaxID=253161 RepID=UPI0026014456|nr:precorrin-4 C(11)-methyltransferase [uncultured Methanobrevibacter sp.]
MKGKCVFIGAGPGDVELLTLKGYKVIQKAEVIIYAGSLVNPKILEYNENNAKIYNSASMDLNETIEAIKKCVNEGKLVARVHTGDPSIYGAIAEQIRELKKLDIEYEIIPGVSSVFGAAATLESELTLPEISQTVIITRPEGRTPKPEGESLSSLSKHHGTMCIFLGVGMIEDVVDELLVGYEKTTPVAVVKKATWPDEEIVRGTLEDITEKVKKAGFRKTSMIIVGDAIGTFDFNPSKLYDKDFKHEYRN